MRRRFNIKENVEVILVYIVLFAIFVAFAVASVVALTSIIHFYTERETNVIATDLEIDLDAMVEESGEGVANPEVRHMLEVYGNLHDLDIVITDRKGIVESSSVRSLKVGEPLFSQESYFSPAEPYLMHGGTLHFLDGAWVSEQDIMNVTYCTTRPVIGTDSRVVVLARNSKLMLQLGKSVRIFLIVLGILFILTLLLITRILFRYNRRIVELATVDELTGIANRKSFVRRYEERSRRGLPKGSLLFMLDVDKFKQVNDGYGHAAGDQALVFVSQRIQSLMNQNCMAGRWGGDEFIGIYTNGRLSAKDKLNMLLKEIREMPIELDDGRELHVTVSIGAVLVDTKQTLNENLERADAVLYTSKEKGRNCLTFEDAIE